MSRVLICTATPPPPLSTLPRSFIHNPNTKLQLVIPKHHGAHLTDIPDEQLREILPVAKRLVKATGAEHYNILQNNGRIAHQVVDHVSSHVSMGVWRGKGGDSEMKERADEDGSDRCIFIWWVPGVFFQSWKGEAEGVRRCGVLIRFVGVLKGFGGC
jgi:hypothetical protein